MHVDIIFFSNDYFIALFSKSDSETLQKEVTTMLYLKHPNVMSLIGVCLDGEVPLLIMPFMSNGTVLKYVRQHRKELLLSSEEKQEKVAIAFCIPYILK